VRGGRICLSDSFLLLNVGIHDQKSTPGKKDRDTGLVRGSSYMCVQGGEGDCVKS